MIDDNFTERFQTAMRSAEANLIEEIRRSGYDPYFIKTAIRDAFSQGAAFGLAEGQDVLGKLMRKS